MTLADGAVAATTAARRPTVGDRVVLTADFASHADASGGMSAAEYSEAGACGWGWL